MMTLLILSSLPFVSSQFCSCEDDIFTDDYAGCPIDNFCSSSLIHSECGYECHPGGELHVMPYFPWKSTKYGSSSCVGPSFDFNNDGVAFCAYPDDTQVLTNSSHNCTVTNFECDGCDFSQLLFMNDYHDVFVHENSSESKNNYYQEICKYGYIQVLYADGSMSEERDSMWQRKGDCSIRVNEKDVVALSCLHNSSEMDILMSLMGGHSGLIGHCKFGQCWMYCEDYTKKLNYLPWNWMPRQNATGGFLNCQGMYCYDRGIRAYDVKCI